MASDLPPPKDYSTAAAVSAMQRHLRFRRRLLERIRRRYDILTERLRAGWLEVVFTRIADPSRVFDEVARDEDSKDRLAGRRRPGDELHIPYWAELWESSLGVGQLLAGEDGRRLLAGRGGGRTSVLDLGCGMGFAGCVAAALGAQVLFADLEPPALLFAALNSLPWRDQVRTRRLNWRTDTLDERFNLILGADILYERQQWEYLEPFWRRHLLPGGKILLGEPGRQTGAGFLEWIAPRGWRIEPLTAHLADRNKTIRLFLTAPAETRS